jgi:hypothetical protein
MSLQDLVDGHFGGTSPTWAFIGVGIPPGWMPWPRTLGLQDDECFLWRKEKRPWRTSPSPY